MANAETGEVTKHVTTHCLKCFLYMRISKMDNEYRHISKIFQQFVTNGILSIKQAFLIIFKDKEMWRVPKAH